MIDKLLQGGFPNLKLRRGLKVDLRHNAYLYFKILKLRRGLKEVKDLGINEYKLP